MTFLQSITPWIINAVIGLVVLVAVLFGLVLVRLVLRSIGVDLSEAAQKCLTFIRFIFSKWLQILAILAIVYSAYVYAGNYLAEKSKTAMETGVGNLLSNIAGTLQKNPEVKIPLTLPSGETIIIVCRNEVTPPQK